MLFQPALPLIVLCTVIVGGGALIAVWCLAGASSGQHVWSPGAMLRAPAGDGTQTRHTWRPGAGGDTIRVDELLLHAAEAAPTEHGGRHYLTEPVPADERLVDDAEVTRPIRALYTHDRPPIRIAS